MTGILTAPPTWAHQAKSDLLGAYATGTAVAPLRERLLPVGDIDAAYAVQKEMTSHWLAQGRRLVGAKIGLTNPAVQSVFGVFQPDFGVLFADMAVPDGDVVDLSRLIQPRVEAEVAFVLGADLPHQEVTSVDVIRATEYVLPAIEIVDSRVAGWDISIVDTVADNASSGLYVLGTKPVSLSQVDLRLCGMVLEHQGEPVSVGAGAACLGNPLNAVTWLATTMARMGSPLKAGDVVLSGALGPMISVTPGARYEARISGLGSVRVGFTGASGPSTSGPSTSGPSTSGPSTSGPSTSGGAASGSSTSGGAASGSSASGGSGSGQAGSGSASVAARDSVGGKPSPAAPAALSTESSEEDK